MNFKYVWTDMMYWRGGNVEQHQKLPKLYSDPLERKTNCLGNFQFKHIGLEPTSWEKTKMGYKRTWFCLNWNPSFLNGKWNWEIKDGIVCFWNEVRIYQRIVLTGVMMSKEYRLSQRRVCDFLAPSEKGTPYIFFRRRDWTYQYTTYYIEE